MIIHMWGKHVIGYFVTINPNNKIVDLCACYVQYMEE